MNDPRFPISALVSNDVASQRHAAVSAFLDAARGLLDHDAAIDRETLGSVARHLERLGRRAELFPPSDFPVSTTSPAGVFRLAEDVDGGYALYVSAGLPGKFQPPHDHTTWAIIAGVTGNERNVFYRREPTDNPQQDRLVETARSEVVSGSSVTLLPDDVHTIELIGDQPGLHLHFYGLALDRLHDRVVFENTAGGSYRRFGPPKHIGHPAIDPRQLKAALADGGETAVLDVREAVVYVHGHLLLAASAPLWRLELLVDRLVPRRDARIVLVDGGQDKDRLAHEAAAKLIRLGWGNVSVLTGGTAGWAEAGFEVFSGSNVPSKAFGEVIEHTHHTPWIDVEELARAVERGDDLVVVDSRTPEEFADFSLPFAHSLPGAELVYRIGEIAPRPETLVVVNCAGRTRSIVGAQTLIDAGVPNPVVSLKDGTMAWLLSGRTLAHGRKAPPPEPADSAQQAARARAEAVASRAGVRRIGADELADFEAETGRRTLYRFDVRARAEYEAGHLPGWRWAPGGQLVQATDEYAPTRHARAVLADWDGVRALTTAAWLAQIGSHEVFIYAPSPFAELETGPEPRRVLASRPPARLLSVAQANALQRDGKLRIFDVERRTAFERQHIAGAQFAVPDRLASFVDANAPEGQPGAASAGTIAITSADGVLARTVAAELAARTGYDVRALTGGTQAWVAAGLPVGQGADDVLTDHDDHWVSPYQLADEGQRNAGFQAYLDWEVGLVAQLEREGDIGIRLLTH